MSALSSLPVARAVPAVTAAQMAAADRIASTDIGVPLEALMETASRQVALVTRLLLDGVAGRRIVALSGTGNNGGDALGALRHLHGWGAHVGAIVAGPRDRLGRLAALQYDILSCLGVPLLGSPEADDATIVHRLQQADTVLDGLLGYGASGAPRGEIARLIELAVGGAPGRMVAVDLPSGLDPDDGTPLGGDAAGAIRADVTVTLALPKAGLLRAPARAFVGELVLADIGIPAKAYEHLGVDAREVFAPGDLVRIIR